MAGNVRGGRVEIPCTSRENRSVIDVTLHDRRSTHLRTC